METAKVGRPLLDILHYHQPIPLNDIFRKGFVLSSPFPSVE